MDPKYKNMTVQEMMNEGNMNEAQSGQAAEYAKALQKAKFKYKQIGLTSAMTAVIHSTDVRFEFGSNGENIYVSIDGKSIFRVKSAPADKLIKLLSDLLKFSRNYS